MTPFSINQNITDFAHFVCMKFAVFVISELILSPDRASVKRNLKIGSCQKPDRCL